MSLVLTKQHVIQFQGDKWTVPGSMVLEKGGKEWLAVFPSNYSLCKLIHGDTFDRKKKFSLKNVQAFEDLINERNVKSKLVAEEESLFDDQAKPAPKRRRTTPTADQEDEELQLELPGGSGTITCMAAKKLSDALLLHMTEANLNVFFTFFHGSDTTSEKARAYQASGKYKGVAAKRKAKQDVAGDIGQEGD